MDNNYQEPTPPKDMTNRALDVHYGVAKDSKYYSICPKCNGTNCHNCQKGVILKTYD